MLSRGQHELMANREVKRSPSAGCPAHAFYDAVSRHRQGHYESIQAIAGHAVQASALVPGQRLGQASGQVGQEFKLQIPNAHLWSPDDPFLYDLEVTLTSNEGDQQVSFRHRKKCCHSFATEFNAAGMSMMIAWLYA